MFIDLFVNSFMKRERVYKKFILLTLCIGILFSGKIFATSYYPYYPDYNPYYPNYNPYYPNYNPYYPNYNPYAIPYNCYYYISAYDRPVTSMYNREPMTTRIPIINSNYPYYANVANGIVYNAYRSISRWCNENLFTNNVQSFYLNHAFIENSTPTNIVMIVNCAIQKKGIIASNIEFRLNVNVASNRYTWRKIGNNNSSYEYDYRVYEYDSLTDQVVPIG